jgi:hypothetical protein
MGLAKIESVNGYDISEGAKALAKRLLERGAVPVGSEEDALHIAVAAAAGMSYLLTWNFKHSNNAETKEQIMEVVESHGFVCPTLCSPEELGL